MKSCQMPSEGGDQNCTLELTIPLCPQQVGHPGGCAPFLASCCSKDKRFGKSDLGRKIEGTGLILSIKERTRRQQVKTISSDKVFIQGHGWIALHIQCGDKTRRVRVHLQQR